MADSPPPPAPKAVASLAKRPSDVTRLGAHKLKFVPTLPARRKKEDVKKADPAPAPTAPSPARPRGADRARGRGRGTDGRPAPSRPPPVELTASGPFAMGPALAGTSARRTAPRSNFAPVVPQGPGLGAKLGAGLTQTTVPSLKRDADAGKEQLDGDEAEVYSDPDDGVDIVDMDNIRHMDWMAPDSLARDKAGQKKKKKNAVAVKKDDPEKQLDLKGKGASPPPSASAPEVLDVDGDEEREVVNLANAVDLSESEEEEELEDIIDDFAMASDTQDDPSIRQERLYFFQFPRPFPTFLSKSPASSGPTPGAAAGGENSPKKVTFADDTKSPAPAGSAAAPDGPPEPAFIDKGDQKIDGVIGQLEIYESGAVKMRLANGMVMDVSAATQPSFLQQAVYLDPTNKHLCVLGEVNRRFIVSPDIETLLTSMEVADNASTLELGEGLISMDTA
ncbi:RNA polymerase III RPC4-domain-containing protein [Amylocystis lapponica]|nr:RNA polymerase III RPC4-domain-containing protein [Amylocystis lapponica]